MTYDDLVTLLQTGDKRLEFSPEITFVRTPLISGHESWPCALPPIAATFGGQTYAAFPIHPIPTSCSFLDDVAVRDIHGAELGVLCLTSRIRNLVISDLTHFRLLALATDLDTTTDLASHRFNTDWLVLRCDQISGYFSHYAMSSGLWGGYAHYTPPPSTIAPSVAEVIARPGITFPRAEYTEAITRACLSDWTFYRFLKLYHLLELKFDVHLLESIKAVGDDLRGFAALLARYRHEERLKLTSILSDRITDLSALARILYTIDWNDSTLQEIMDFGKKGVPSTFQGETGKRILSEWSRNRWFTWPGDSVARSQKMGTESEHRELIIELIAFLIYRARCCIAHFRIGEYLLRESDERIIREAVEPLIKEVLNQVFGAPP
jgi:hypothetical protein